MHGLRSFFDDAYGGAVRASLASASAALRTYCALPSRTLPCPPGVRGGPPPTASSLLADASVRVELRTAIASATRLGFEVANGGGSLGGASDASATEGGGVTLAGGQTLPSESSGGESSGGESSGGMGWLATAVKRTLAAAPSAEGGGGGKLALNSASHADSFSVAVGRFAQLMSAAEGSKLTWQVWGRRLGMGPGMEQGQVEEEGSVPPVPQPHPAGRAHGTHEGSQPGQQQQQQQGEEEDGVRWP